MVPLGLIAATIGLVTWVATMAKAPLYSYGPDEDLGDLRYYIVVLLLAAVAVGVVAPTRPWLLGCTAGATWPGALALDSSARRRRWTLGSDRPTALGGFVLALMAVARVGAWARSHFPHADR